MTDVETVERVARALCINDAIEPDEEADCSMGIGRRRTCPAWQLYEQAAHAAIAVLQPPIVAEAARVLLEHGIQPGAYAVYGNDRTDAYARGYCGGVEATVERVRALTKGEDRG